MAKLKELGIELRQDLSLALDVLQIECSAASLRKLDVVIHDLNKISIDADVLRERATLISTNVQSLEASSQKTLESISGLLATHSNEYRRKVYDWLSPLTMEFQGKHPDTSTHRGGRILPLNRYLKPQSSGIGRVNLTKRFGVQAYVSQISPSAWRSLPASTTALC